MDLMSSIRQLSLDCELGGNNIPRARIHSTEDLNINALMNVNAPEWRPNFM